MGLYVDKLTGNIYLFDISSSGGTGTSGSTYQEVNTFADLPPAASFPTRIFVVRTSTGAYVINRREAGLYYSNGVTWRRLGDIPSFFNDDNFKIYDGNDNTKEIRFQLSGVTGLRTLTVQNASGTLAYLSDITGSSSGRFGTAHYTAITNNQTASDPGNGNLRWNNATLTASTRIFVDSLTDSGIDINNFLAKVSVGTILYIQELNDASNTQSWEITGVTNNTGWWTLGVTLLNASGTFTNNNKIGIMIGSVSADNITQAEFDTYSANTANLINTKIGSANNGLTKIGTNVRLGGNLTGSTQIGLGANNLTFTGTTGTLRYGSDLSANYNNRSLVDKGFVTGYTGFRTSTEVGAVRTIVSNQDVVGQGQVTLTNGSGNITGIGTNFLDATAGLGVSYWFTIFVTDSANNVYELSLATIPTNTSATISLAFNINDIRDGHGTNQGSTFPGVSGTYNYHVIRNFGEDLFSIVGGNRSLARNFSTAFGGGVSAVGQTSFATGRFTSATGARAFAIGFTTKASGADSFVGGVGTVAGGVDRRVLATGAAAFNFSVSNALQIVGHGARAAGSAILGGLNHDVPSNSLRSAILGGNTIKAVSAVTDTVYLPNVRIGQGIGGALVSGSTSADLIVRNIGGVLQTRTVASVLAGLSANNGVRRTGDNFRLGGQLTGSTNIGLGANNLIFTGTSGTLRYGSDLSASYNVRSLVDKGYVTGLTSLVVLQAVFNIYSAATLTNINSRLLRSDFTGYSATTLVNINSRLLKTTFNTYTGATATQQIILISTGTTDMNQVVATSVPFHIQRRYDTTHFLFTGGTNIRILTAGVYEVSYHMNIISGSASAKSVGANVYVNGTINNNLLSSGYLQNNAALTSLSLPSIEVTFAANDLITLRGYRLLNNGTANTVPNSVFISIRKKV